MDIERQKREIERIRAGYYQQHNYTWQYVLQPSEAPSLLSRKVNKEQMQIAPFYPANDWTDFIRFKYGPAGCDCDSSAAAMLTFQLAYDYLYDGELIPRSDKYGEYEIRTERTIYRGDTMTSGWMPLKRYLAYQHQELQREDQESQKFHEFDLWVKVYKEGVPMTNLEHDPYRGFKEYCYYFAEQLAAPVEQVLSEDCKLFLENVWNQGNIVPVPEFFNKARASNEYGDTVDRMLTYLYYYMTSSAADPDKYLDLLFCVEGKKQEDAEDAKEAVNKTKGWIHHVCGEKRDKAAWNSFVELHFLQPFCRLDESGIYIPVCMFNNKPLQYACPPYPETQLKFLPDSLKECECFFGTLNTAIRQRSSLIQQKINEQL